MSNVKVGLYKNIEVGEVFLISSSDESYSCTHICLMAKERLDFSYIGEVSSMSDDIGDFINCLLESGKVNELKIKEILYTSGDIYPTAISFSEDD